MVNTIICKQRKTNTLTIKGGSLQRTSNFCEPRLGRLCKPIHTQYKFFFNQDRRFYQSYQYQADNDAKNCIHVQSIAATYLQYG